MIHEILPVGMLACNCSIVGDEETGEAIVIDPGDEIERVQEVLAQHKLRAKYIVATHAHIDHVGGLEELKRATGAAVLMHAGDLPLYQNLAMQAEWLGVPPPGVVDVDQFLKEGDALRFGPHSWKSCIPPDILLEPLPPLSGRATEDFQRRYPVPGKHRPDGLVGGVLRGNPALYSRPAAGLPR